MKTTHKPNTLSFHHEVSVMAKALPFIAAALATACGSADQPKQPTDTLRIQVAPLTLPGVEEVTYGLSVVSAAGPVWSKSGLTSTQYGDGQSALTYIGPCDASANPHTVELTIENIRAGGQNLLHPQHFINPAPVGQPIVQTQVECVPNGDTPVTFNVTILRNAQQGFFDIAVNFSDTFCSAKLDCSKALLHNPETGAREPTAIVAFACTSGVGEPTFIHLADLVLTCTDDDSGATTTYTLPYQSSPGQHGPVTSDLANDPGVFQWATYSGQEELASDGQPIEKCYINRAVGLDLAALTALGLERCTLSTIGTATSSADGLSAIGAPGSTYPVIEWSVEVLGPDGTLCENHPLNGTPAGVATRYIHGTDSHHAASATPAFSGMLTCGEVAPPPVFHCGEVASIMTNSAKDGATVTIQTAGGTTTFPLPPGVTLADTCCVDGCCDSTILTSGMQSP